MGIPTLINSAPTFFTANLGGLTAGVTYHYRARAAAGAITVDGADQQFTPGVN